MHEKNERSALIHQKINTLTALVFIICCSQ